MGSFSYYHERPICYLLQHDYELFSIIFSRNCWSSEPLDSNVINALNKGRHRTKRLCFCAWLNSFLMQFWNHSFIKIREKKCTATGWPTNRMTSKHKPTRGPSQGGLYYDCTLCNKTEWTLDHENNMIKIRRGIHEIFVTLSFVVVQVFMFSLE